MQPIITIVIPQYKTFQVTLLCLRALKKFSTLNFEQAEGDVADALYRNHIKDKQDFVLMGRSFLKNILWHTSNVSSILTGQMTDSKSISKLHQKLNSLFSSAAISELLRDDSLDCF